MKISTNGRYALRVMADIAINEKDGNVSITDISNRNKISNKYLEQIISLLVKSNLLTSKRGKQGGYTLSKPAKEITVGEIIKQTEGNLETVSCLSGTTKCEMACNCLTVDVWFKLEKIIQNFLNSTTLHDVITKNVL